MEKVFKVEKGMELPKRTHLRGVIYEKECPCGGKAILNLEDNYLSYPCVGEYEEVSIYCEDCDTYLQLQVKVDMMVTIKDEGCK